MGLCLIYSLGWLSLSWLLYLKLIDLLSFLTFLIASLILLECIINLSTYRNYFLSYFFVFILSLYCLIRSKNILFYSLNFWFYNLYWLVCGALNDIRLIDFLLSISSIFFTRDRFSNITGSTSSWTITLNFLDLDIFIANSPLSSQLIRLLKPACEL